jgi:phosphopantothenoylcysteine synthetase/decarboxylase
MAATLDALVTRTLEGIEVLVTLGSTIEDEWQYVADLRTVWTGRLAAVAAARGSEPVSDAAVAAIEAAVTEAERIGDPHRAIDWLSTLPQVALLAMGEEA